MDEQSCFLTYYKINQDHVWRALSIVMEHSYVKTLNVNNPRPEVIWSQTCHPLEQDLTVL